MAHKKVFETLDEAQDFVRPWVDKVSAESSQAGSSPFSLSRSTYSDKAWFIGCTPFDIAAMNVFQSFVSERMNPTSISVPSGTDSPGCMLWLLASA